MKFTRSALVKVAGAAVALAALGTASVAQARVFVSASVPIVPGVSLGVANGPVYYQPSVGYYPGYPAQTVQPAYYPQQVYPQQVVYQQPAPVYYQPAPVYYNPAPILSIGFGGWYGGGGYRGWHHGHR
ncbi:MAG: hypothetical protein HYX47_18435 [Burkholderiales bacterium]|nr:hypothetical protein [Burkholderiales bacterium]